MSPDEGLGGSVELAVLADPALTERQKQSLLDVYQSFLAMNGAAAGSGAGPGPAQPGEEHEATP